MQISAVIITKNEEHNIERCLQSLQGIADEVIVVDCGSTDKTKEICEKYQVQFVYQEWLGYAEQKNYANSLSKYDIILSIDADEALSEELKTSLLKLKLSEKQNFVCQIIILTNYCGKWIYHCGWYPDKKIRIFNRKTTKWVGTIHERLFYSNDTEIIQLKGDLLHYSYYSIEEHIFKSNRYSTLASKECFERNETISIIAIIAKTVWRFLRDYFFKGGFLDGFYGFVICRINATTTFLKYIKLRQLWKNIMINY
jgi:glycosyltransferase involved in cell wall biosynthesis